MNSTQILAQLGSMYGTSDWTQWNPYPQPFYDSVSYPAAGTTQLDFFAVPISQNDPNGTTKTLEDTNMSVPRQLGMNYLWILEIRMGIFVKPKNRQVNAIAADANLIFSDMSGMFNKWLELFNRGTLEIAVDSKNYHIIDRPFKRCPAGIGLDLGNFSEQAAAGPAIQPVGWIQNNNDDANIFAETPGLWIAPTQTLQISIKWYDGTGPVFTNLVAGASPAIQLKLFLNGYMFKARQ